MGCSCSASCGRRASPGAISRCSGPCSRSGRLGGGRRGRGSASKRAQASKPKSISASCLCGSATSSPRSTSSSHAGLLRPGHRLRLPQRAVRHAARRPRAGAAPLRRRAAQLPLRQSARVTLGRSAGQVLWHPRFEDFARHCGSTISTWATRFAPLRFIGHRRKQRVEHRRQARRVYPLRSLRRHELPIGCRSDYVGRLDGRADNRPYDLGPARRNRNLVCLRTLLSGLVQPGLSPEEPYREA